MSTKTQPVASEATNEEYTEFLDSHETTATPEQPKKKKNVFYRLLAFVLAIAPIVVYFLLNATIIVSGGNGYALYKDGKLLDIFLSLFGVKEGGVAAASTLFGFIPLTTVEGGVLGYVANAIMYLIPIAMVVTVIAAIIALFSGKAAPSMARFILYVNFWMYFGYALSLALINVYVGGQLVEAFDYATLAIAGACLVIYMIASLIKSGKRAWIGLIVFLFTAASAAAIVYAILLDVPTLKALFTENILYKWIGLGIIGAYAICLLIAFGGISAKKLCGADIIRCIVMMILGGGVIYLALTNETAAIYLLYGAIAAGEAFALMIIEIIVLAARPKQKNTEEAEAEEATTEEATVEEPTTTEETTVEEPETVVEAVAIEEEAPVQETAAPVQEEAPVQETAAPVQEATPAPEEQGDPFLLTLTSEEKAQFVSLFILKSKGDLGLPEYKYGADNSKFFRKIFVNLGMLRAKIPDGLMYKIYKFVTKE